MTIALAIWLWPAPAVAQEHGVPFDGTQAFRNILGVFKLQPVPEIEDFGRFPASKTVLIVFGDLGCLDRLFRARTVGLRRFVDDGGAVLIASDRNDNDNRYLREFDLSIPGRPPPDGRLAWRDYVRMIENNVPAPPLDEFWKPYPHLERYKNFGECIKINYHPSLTHPIFAHCQRGIVTNSPSYIVRGSTCTLDLLCSFPYLRTEEKGPGFFVDARNAFAVGSRASPGANQRVLFLSGHGVFMNAMLAQPDIDNLTFAVNTVRWLTNDKQRSHCLFVEENQVINDFNVAIADPPLPTARLFDNLLRGWEEENFFNKLLRENVNLRSLQRGLVIAALAVMAMFGLRLVLRSRFGQEHG